MEISFFEKQQMYSFPRSPIFPFCSFLLTQLPTQHSYSPLLYITGGVDKGISKEGCGICTFPLFISPLQARHSHSGKHTEVMSLSSMAEVSSKTGQRL